MKMKRCSILQKVDMFGKQVNINFRGESTHTTTTGGLLSLVAMIPIFFYVG